MAFSRRRPFDQPDAIPASPSPVILLVDPDPHTRDAWAHHLRKRDYVIYAIDDGRVALAYALRLCPVAVVTTRDPRGLDGFQLCALLRLDSQTRNTRIVFVADDASDRELATRAGADVALEGPVPPEIVWSVIEQLRAEGPSAPGEPPLSEMSAEGVATKRIRQPRTHITQTPPSPPPRLFCERCDRSLRYVQSHIGGVDARNPEQWDLFECENGCGMFQYRQRTRKLTRRE